MTRIAAERPPIVDRKADCSFTVRRVSATEDAEARRLFEIEKMKTELELNRANELANIRKKFGLRETLELQDAILNDRGVH